jgi:hypothetical protein
MGMTDNDYIVKEIAAALMLSANGGTPDMAIANTPTLAEAHALSILLTYQKALREPGAYEKAHALPVRKAVLAGDGGGRYYWRMALENGCVIPAVTNLEKNKGDLAIARRMARLHIIDGVNIVELIPPDIDPQSAIFDERQRNNSSMQPAGMTVRQRAKKH